MPSRNAAPAATTSSGVEPCGWSVMPGKMAAVAHNESVSINHNRKNRRRAFTTVRTGFMLTSGF
jgi:hypothetical protein